VYSVLHPLHNLQKLSAPVSLDGSNLHELRPPVIYAHTKRRQIVLWVTLSKS